MTDTRRAAPEFTRFSDCTIELICASFGTERISPRVRGRLELAAGFFVFCRLHRFSPQKTADQLNRLAARMLDLFNQYKNLDVWTTNFLCHSNSNYQRANPAQIVRAHKQAMKDHCAELAKLMSRRDDALKKAASLGPRKKRGGNNRDDARVRFFLTLLKFTKMSAAKRSELDQFLQVHSSGLFLQ